jgi:hypothetical protein
MTLATCRREALACFQGPGLDGIERHPILIDRRSNKLSPLPSGRSLWGPSGYQKKEARPDAKAEGGDARRSDEGRDRGSRCQANRKRWARRVQRAGARKGHGGWPHLDPCSLQGRHWGGSRRCRRPGGSRDDPAVQADRRAHRILSRFASWNPVGAACSTGGCRPRRSSPLVRSDSGSAAG